jgi:hypothetical protein
MASAMIFKNIVGSYSEHPGTSGVISQVALTATSHIVRLGDTAYIEKLHRSSSLPEKQWVGGGKVGKAREARKQQASRIGCCVEKGHSLCDVVFMLPCTVQPMKYESTTVFGRTTIISCATRRL